MKIKDKLLENSEYIIAKYLEGVSTCELGREMECSNASIWKFLQQQGVSLRSPPILDEHKDNIIKLYKEGHSGYRIGKMLGLSDGTINRYMKSLDLDLSNNSKNRIDQLKNYTKEIIKDYDNGQGCYLLARKYKCSETSIQRILKKNNVKIRGPRIYTFNENYFEKIDTEAKAYLLGFMYADGNNMNNYIRLSITDKEILEFFKKEVDYTGEIKQLKKREKDVKGQYSLTLCSNKMCDDLTKLGCGHNKTFTIKFPTPDQVPPNLVKHFLRGNMDGDGCITQDGFNHWYVHFLGTEEFITGVSKIVKEQIDKNYKIHKFYKTDTNIRRITIGGNEPVLNFLNWLYSDSTIYLQRKYQKYQKIKLVYIKG